MSAEPAPAHRPVVTAALAGLSNAAHQSSRSGQSTATSRATACELVR